MHLLLAMLDAYANALVSGTLSLDQVVQHFCRDNHMDANASSSQVTAHLVTLLLQKLQSQQSTAAYVAPLLEQQLQDDAAVAYTHHQTRAAAVARTVEAAVNQKLLFDDNPLVNLFN